jgi:uncharacterized protein YbcC (UPF0753/DUF2309 family)
MPSDPASDSQRTDNQRQAWQASIERAAAAVGRTWPVYAFVTANPLADLEDQPFNDAVRRAQQSLGASVFPAAAVFRKAWQSGQIDAPCLSRALRDAGYDQTPGQSLRFLEKNETPASADRGRANTAVDHALSKWLAVFLDEGQAEWPMPRREAGFYAAWRAIAPYDSSIPNRRLIADQPGSAIETIAQLLGELAPDQQAEVLEAQLTALPGWASRIKQREASDSPWQQVAPITLADFLAVRLSLCRAMNVPFTHRENSATDATLTQYHTLAACWLQAWEQTYRNTVTHQLQHTARQGAPGDSDTAKPSAQCVFCIDTRSEIIRRHLEQVGPYETFGYAGFFGIPMRYQGYNAEVAENACPPILEPRHHIRDRAHDEHHQRADRAHAWRRTFSVGRRLVNDLKHNVGAAFNFVESSGAPYGLAMIVRTLVPRAVRKAARLFDWPLPDDDHICQPDLDGQTASGGEALAVGLTFEQRVQYAEAAFTLMGWEHFAPLVVLLGHGSESVNNPYASSLHCGACAGRPGGPNARVLATICNDPAVREALQQRGITIPDDTFVLAGQHNTTTDEVSLFTQDVPASHVDALRQLETDLATAQARAACERSAALGDPQGHRYQAELTRRAAHWAEPRPEWGLAGNAAFIIGPRWLTRALNLAGRCFLHSYDWQQDDDGQALETIMGGPMVVTQWINNHYYFATVDNTFFGSGSKITHNPIGNIGVVQGNGGDLMTGLPLQSIASDDEHAFHQPLRLTVIIHAPAQRIFNILDNHPHLMTLVQNGWIALQALDPQREHELIDIKTAREHVAA